MKEQTKQLQDVHRRALQVMFGNIRTTRARHACNILSLSERRHKLGARFFLRIIRDELNVLSYLLPAKHDVQLITRLRRARLYPTIYERTGLIVIKTLSSYTD